jgi:hypothetical protein
MVHMKGMKHSYVMGGLLGVAVVLFLAGVGGGAVFLLWPLACAGMMVAMMWGMHGMGTKHGEHTHPDGVTHVHEDDAVGSRKGGRPR